MSEGEPSAVLAELEAESLSSAVDLVLRRNGSWDMTCEYPEVLANHGVLSAVRLDEWQRRLDAVGTPVRMRQYPAANDAPVSVVDGDEVESGSAEAELASDLHSFAARICGSSSEEAAKGSEPGAGQPLRVSEARGLRAIDRVSVRGFVISRDGDARICDARLDSMPPQCSRISLELTGPGRGQLTRGELAVRHARGVTWTVEPVTLTGRIAGGVLRVE